VAKSISGRFATGNEHPMKPLFPKESRDYVLKTINYLIPKIKGEVNERIADWLCGECSDWPHHLRNGMASIVQTVLESDTDHPEHWDSHYMMNIFQDARTEYYEKRLSGPMSDFPSLATRVFTAIDEPLTRGSAVGKFQQVLDDFWKEYPTNRDALAEQGVNNASALVRHLVAQGVLARTVPKNNILLQPSILSLKTYVIEGEHRFNKSFPLLNRYHSMKR